MVRWVCSPRVHIILPSLPHPDRVGSSIHNVPGCVGIYHVCTPNLNQAHGAPTISVCRSRVFVSPGVGCKNKQAPLSATGTNLAPGTNARRSRAPSSALAGTRTAGPRGMTWSTGQASRRGSSACGRSRGGTSSCRAKESQRCWNF